jgi:hypothetical protein
MAKLMVIINLAAENADTDHDEELIDAYYISEERWVFDSPAEAGDVYEKLTIAFNKLLGETGKR